MTERRYTLSEITAAMGVVVVRMAKEGHQPSREFIDKVLDALKNKPEVPVDRDAALDKIVEILSPND